MVVERKQRKTTQSLIARALNAEDGDGLSQLLKSLAEAYRASGCVLWEVQPDDYPGTSVFVLAAWFEGDSVFALHDIPLNESLSGVAISTGLPQLSPDVRKDDRH